MTLRMYEKALKIIGNCFYFVNPRFRIEIDFWTQKNIYIKRNADLTE